MSKKRKIVSLVVWLALIVATLAGAILCGTGQRAETIQETMRDAVLHETNKVRLFGLLEVNPAVISSLVVVGILLAAALLIRIFFIPRFKRVPSRAQLLLEQLVGFFTDLGKGNSPHRYRFLNAYIFGVGVYIFFGTLFELLGLQVSTTHGNTIALPAPLSDINAAIAVGCFSYLVILIGGISANGLRGLGRTLKEFSLPISMSFRLFGALLSGLLVTELVYYYVGLSFVLPVVIAVLFTLLHALIQAYVLTMLTSVFYGEVTEAPRPKPKKSKKQLES